MKISNLSLMKRGWFVGNFEPSLFKTNQLEAAVKIFKEGDFEKAHYHKIALEITVIISGKVRMFNKIWESGDIIIAEPYDITDFKALTDVTITVIKVPCIKGDKYLVDKQS